MDSSILNHIGVTELAKNINHYVELAIKVGTNKLYSNELRKKIKENCHKLFHINGSKAWENIFLDLYNKEENKFINNKKYISNNKINYNSNLEK